VHGSQAEYKKLIHTAVIASLPYLIKIKYACC
jgi:hypothetical protein